MWCGVVWWVFSHVSQWSMGILLVAVRRCSVRWIVLFGEWWCCSASDVCVSDGECLYNDECTCDGEYSKWYGEHISLTVALHTPPPRDKSPSYTHTPWNNTKPWLYVVRWFFTCKSIGKTTEQQQGPLRLAVEVVSCCRVTVCDWWVVYEWWWVTASRSGPCCCSVVFLLTYT